MDRLNHLKRAFPRRRLAWGCFYVGCVAPLAFSMLGLVILVKAIASRVQRRASDDLP